MDSDERIAIAYVKRAKGTAGHVRAQPLTHDVERFDGVVSVVLQKEGRPDRPLRLTGWRMEGSELLLKFDGVDTPEEAREALAGGYVTVARDEVPELPEDTFYVFELVGCSVVDERGARLGELVEVLHMPSTDVYRVQGPTGELLLPAVASVVTEVRVAERLVRVQGVEELMQSS